MGWLSDWLDNVLMGGEERPMDLSLIEKKIPIEKHLEAGKKRIEEARKENKEEEKAEEGLKHVIDGAKLKCDLCTNPEGDLKVNFDTPTIQDKKAATIKEKDKTSLIFKGNCKKSPQSNSPCASVMQLGAWKNTGTSLIQDQPPVLLKSTIKCNYGGVDIKITDCGQKCEPEKIDVVGAPVPEPKKVDFDIKIEIIKNDFVPLGIADYKGNKENDKIKFKLIITGNGVNSWTFEIRTSNTLVYQCFSNTNELEQVVIVGKGNGGQKKQETTNESVPMERFWPAGSYIIEWDGFNNNEIYDSVLMTNEEGFVASIIGQAEQKQKKYTMEDPFMFKNTEVNWVDVKIDNKNKRIDTTLRVDLRDGGAKGLNCYTHTEDETMLNGESNPFNGISTTVCDWDKIPKEALDFYNQEPIKVRSKSFEELRNLALQGINQFWSRNSNNIGKGVNINGALFEVSVNAKADENGMKAPKLIYFTNSEMTDFTRSHNWELHRELYFYEGYIYNDGQKTNLTKGWKYTGGLKEILEFKDAAAHEIGHQLLFEYGGAGYSGRDYTYSHKGTSGPTWVQQDALPGTKYPDNGEEIDLMKYAITNRPKDYFDRVVLSNEDSLGLVWLTKFKIISIFCVVLFFSSCQKRYIKDHDRETVNYYNGIVVDKEKKPINNVTVTLTEINYDKRIVLGTTITNSMGYFKIKNKAVDSLHFIRDVQIGNEILIFEKKGYILDSVDTYIGQSSYRPLYDSFDGYFFVFKIPDTLVLVEHKK